MIIVSFIYYIYVHETNTHIYIHTYTHIYIHIGARRVCNHIVFSA